jgi:hypothetical protein
VPVEIPGLTGSGDEVVVGGGSDAVVAVVGKESPRTIKVVYVVKGCVIESVIISGCLSSRVSNVGLGGSLTGNLGGGAGDIDTEAELYCLTSSFRSIESTFPDVFQI